MLNRLVREDNKPLSKTYTYSYDNNGNIMLKREFAFTLKATEQLEELESTDTVYTYDGDKLMSYGNEKCVYDALGNPTTYRGKACTWEKGRQLTNYGGTTFKYNGKGKRSEKRPANGQMNFYLYDHEDKLVTEGSGLEFIYDDKGAVGVNCSGETFIYRKNIQGDVIAILDSLGNVVVKYNYDAWGNHEVELVDSGYAYLAEWNPLRYRGYYYDVETGLYYLDSRYYDPQTGRFITIDDLSYIDPETINGLNLYAYCGNNPVMNVDPTGHDWWSDFWQSVGNVVAIIVGAAATMVGVGLTVASGGVAGAIIGSALIGMGSATLGNITAQIQTVGWNKVDHLQTLAVGAIGFVTGALTGIVSIGVGEMAKGIGKTIGLALSQMTIKGVQVSKIFNPTVMTNVFGFISKYLGIAGATYLSDYFGNKAFGLDYSQESAIGTTSNLFLSWILNLWKFFSKN